MSDIVIAGLGQTNVGEHYEISLRDLALLAIEPALHETGGLRPDILFVGNMLAPAASHQAHLGALISDYSGLDGNRSFHDRSRGCFGRGGTPHGLPGRQVG